ncbi:uncharacterized protein LAESUDRAFT_521232 [Laetiporus sulphureus 93-53]|uniref:Uncharacterized protein n=1 Tax=Laetiporus sulphureus 93-53 TaxID=1314785 RepID=A0A165G498_9APHY|nr:uncharacterized protein LAESUDRAFT_521232 [Laetiporus sulphureus 93-53]KZT09809.1 hypothetical protein LAESUDRAFT_521232 [Laetiporus sulphureus 93-53]
MSPSCVQSQHALQIWSKCPVSETPTSVFLSTDEQTVTVAHDSVLHSISAVKTNTCAFKTLATRVYHNLYELIKTKHRLSTECNHIFRTRRLLSPRSAPTTGTTAQPVSPRSYSLLVAEAGDAITNIGTSGAQKHSTGLRFCRAGCVCTSMRWILFA